MKIELRDETDRTSHHNPDVGPRPIAIKRSLPFFVSGSGSMTHRVRSGSLHIHTNPIFGGPTVSLRLWCGQQGFLLRRRNQRWAHPGTLHGGLLYPEPPEGRPMCATCEGRAIGAGEPAAAFLHQTREIQFTPREMAS